MITDRQVKSLALTLVLVFAIMFLLFMSFKVGIIGILPNCFPIIVSFCAMGWLGIPLSMATSLIAGVAIGLAVDDTIHYLVGYNHEFKKDLNKERALQSAELLQINERMIKRLQWLYPPTAHRFFFNLMGILCDRLQNLTECYLEETGRGTMHRAPTLQHKILE